MKKSAFMEYIAEEIRSVLFYHNNMGKLLLQMGYSRPTHHYITVKRTKKNESIIIKPQFGCLIARFNVLTANYH